MSKVVQIIVKTTAKHKAELPALAARLGLFSPTSTGEQGNVSDITRIALKAAESWQLVTFIGIDDNDKYELKNHDEHETIVRGVELLCLDIYEPGQPTYLEPIANSSLVGDAAIVKFIDPSTAILIQAHNPNE